MDNGDLKITNILESSPTPLPRKSKNPRLNPYEGTLYIEAQVKSEYNGSLEKLTTKLENIFSSECVHAVQLDNEMIGATLYAECFFPDCLQSLKAVGLVGADDDSDVILVKDYMVTINSYKVQDHKAAETHEALSLCGDAKLLPSLEFHGAWERLIFDEETKQNLVMFMANLLRFSYQKGHNSSSTVNRLILLSGPPGTGKTSLSIGLAQKLSIRLNKTFNDTILLQLNAATLLSQFFGQSAVKIHSIFEALATQSEDQPKTLLVLLIDEIESLAASRESLSARNEVHDAVRATNALLTGFDMVKNNSNVLIICTSNLSASLDAAFVDRCSRHIKIPQPSLSARYEILRHSINGLVERQIIKDPITPLPSFKGAECRLPIDYQTAGCALRRLAEQFEADESNLQPVSARWLSQLAEISLANELAPEAPCAVTHAIQLMKRYVDKNCGYKCSKKHRTLIDQENLRTTREPKQQVATKSSNKRMYSDMFEKTDPDTLVEFVDRQLAHIRRGEMKKDDRLPIMEIQAIVNETLSLWEFKGGCGCGHIVESRLWDYIEHGIPMDRYGFC